MRWKGRRSSTNVKDARGRRVRGRYAPDAGDRIQRLVAADDLDHRQHGPAGALILPALHHVDDRRVAVFETREHAVVLKIVAQPALFFGEPLDV